MKSFRVTGVYESTGKPVSLEIPAEDEHGARHRAKTEGISVTEIQSIDGTPPSITFADRSITFADRLLVIGCLGAIVSCIATVALAFHAYVSGSILVGLLYFPFGSLMAAATAVLFWRVLELSSRRDNPS